MNKGYKTRSGLLDITYTRARTSIKNIQLDKFSNQESKKKTQILKIFEGSFHTGFADNTRRSCSVPWIAPTRQALSSPKST